MLTQTPSPVNRVRKLVYVTTRAHAYTFETWPALLRPRRVSVRLTSYENLLAAPRATRATYILTDFDRLSSSELEAAVHLHDALQAAGLPVLNDPRRFRPRASLLKHLHQLGINSYTCQLPAASEPPKRFPVFLRTIARHRGVLSELLPDLASCDEALSRALSEGYPLSDLVFVEYAAAPHPQTGAFQKLSAFRIGDRIIRANTVNDTHWMAKTGIMGLASAAQYHEERLEMASYPLRDYVMRVFEHANLDFGRLDFGHAGGRYEAYEINTNPYMKMALEHPNADRAAMLSIMQEQLIDALDAQCADLGNGWVTMRPARIRIPRL